MARISGRAAIAAGFRVIAREPAAAAAWCALHLVLGVGPQFLTWRPLIQMYRAIGASGDALGPGVMAAEGEMLRYQPLSYIGALVLLLLVPPAVFRAVLRPEERARFFLRVGARELWSTLAIVVVAVVFFIGYFVALIGPMVIIGVSAGAAANGHPGASIGAILGFVAVVAALGALIWALLRFSFAPVMSFAQNTLRLTESWTLSRGHAGKLFLIWLVLLVLTFTPEIVLVVAALAALGGPQAMAGAKPLAGLAHVGPGALAGFGVALAVLSAWIYIMWSAAWASMYRDLSGGDYEVFS